MNRKLALLCLLQSALLLGAGATRADSLYIGAGGYLVDVQAAEFDDDDIVPAGFIGYQFLDSNLLMLSAEAGYYDLGGISGEVEGIPYAADGQAFTLAGVAYLPVGPFIEVYGKLGMGMMQIDSRFGDDRRDDDETSAFGGFGAALDIFDTVDIYAEYLRFDNAIDSQMVGIGIRLDFF